MSESPEIERILRFARKLHAHAKDRSITEGEAQLYAAEVQKLVHKYRLTMEQIESDGVTQEAVGETLINWSRFGMKLKHKRCDWSEAICKVVAVAYGCAIVVISKSNCLIVIGRRGAREMVVQTCEVLVRTAETISLKEYETYYWKVFKRDGHGRAARGYRESFLVGFCNRLYERFQEEVRRPTGSETSHALVLINKDIVRCTDYINKLDRFSKGSRIKPSEAYNLAGYARGIEVANSLTINQKAISN